MRSLWYSVVLVALALLGANAGFFDKMGVADSVTKHKVECSNANEDIRRDVANHENWPLVEQGGKCGQRVNQPAKILGGQNVDMGEYPWVVQFIYRASRNQTYPPPPVCSGSIINNRYILTAAHCCFDNVDKVLAYVRLGDCYKPQCTPPQVDIGVESVTKHPEFVGGGWLVNDICLVRTTEEIEFTEYVQPICLPVSAKMSKSDFARTEMVVAGWGQTESAPENVFPEVLQEAEVRVLMPWACLNIFGRFNREKQVCAIGEESQNVCPGDSGAPLMLRETAGDGPPRHHLFGLVSLGRACIQEKNELVAGLFTRVSAYLPWILDTIQE